MIVITGASRGIGRYLADRFAEQGEDVIGIYHMTEPSGDKIRFFRADISDAAQVDAFISTYTADLRNLVLINAAGVSYNAFTHKANPAEWAKVVGINLVGLFHMTSKLLPFMREEGFGRIINLSSVVAQTGVMGTSAYAASKAGISGFTRAVARENGAKNITINTINLGYFDIGMIEQVPEAVRLEIVGRIAGGRLGKPEEILSTVDFIVSNAYLNGSAIDLNGGLY